MPSELYYRQRTKKAIITVIPKISKAQPSIFNRVEKIKHQNGVWLERLVSTKRIFRSDEGKRWIPTADFQIKVTE